MFKAPIFVGSHSPGLAKFYAPKPNRNARVAPQKIISNTLGQAMYPKTLRRKPFALSPEP